MNIELQKALTVLLRCRDLGPAVEENLSEWVDSTVRQWRDPDRAWRLKNPLGGINQIAKELARLTYCELDECLEVVKHQCGESEQSARIAGIIEFGKQLPAQRRRGA